MDNKYIPSIPVVFLIGILAFLSSCAKPTIVEADQLAFLESQPRPLFLGDVIKRLGSTEIGRHGPYYEYTIGNTKQSVEFWMYPPRNFPPDGLPSGPLPVEIAMILKTTKNEQNSKPRVVWPKNLDQSAIEAIWKDIWQNSAGN